MNMDESASASPPPPLVCRWLHGGPELDDLTSIPLAQSTKADASASPSVWRSFHDDENDRLEAAWNALDERTRERAWRRRMRQRRQSAATTAAGTSKSRSGKSSVASSRRNSEAAPSAAAGSSQSRTPARARTASNASSKPPSSSTAKAGGEIEDVFDSDEDDEPTEEEQERQGYIADIERESQPHIVHVSTDNLFSCDLISLSLYPAFWKGARIGIQRATWFYPSSTKQKYYPVDGPLAEHLEEAYAEIQPWLPSYADELRSALDIGPEGEAKLKHRLYEDGVDVIFQDSGSARIYAKNLPARLSKSFLTSWVRDKAQSAGGTLVYRGYDTVLRQLAPKTKAGKAEAKAKDVETKAKDKKDALLKSKPSTASLKKPDTPAGTTAADDAENSQKDGKAPTATKAAPSTTSKLGSLFSFGYSTSAGKAASAAGTVSEPAEQADSNSTADALDSTQPAESEYPDDDEQQERAQPEPPATATGAQDKAKSAASADETELAELVLVIHGIGQKLATTYDSFNIVHAINSLRKLCNKQARDETVRKVVGNQRLQFIPLQWRSSLQFDELSREEKEAEDGLDNRFSLEDLQVEGSIPFVSSLVTGVGLDLCFYLSHHREAMVATVIRDANRIYRLFRHRNPSFKGKVSLIAHSLGTALATDILSNQPTWVPDPAADSAISSTTFEFNVSSLFFLGSPVGYMFYLNRGQLIARAGRERTKNVPSSVALDKQGRYGCMAIDSLYSVYNVLDPVAVALNAVVDAEYAKVIKPVAINSVTTSLLSDYASKASSFFSSLIPSFGAAPSAALAAGMPLIGTTSSDKKKPAQEDEGLPATGKEDEAPAKRPALQRPKTKRQFTSELDLAGLKRFQRAEARMLALNPQGSIDFYLSGEGFSQYWDMILSHASYWHDVRFATFLVTQLLASTEILQKAKTKREDDDENEAMSAEGEGRPATADSASEKKA